MDGYGRQDLDHSPLLVFYETTRACDLACVHCRADAQPLCHPQELSTGDALQMLDQLLTFPRPPLLVLTGGDPLKRHDVFELVDYATGHGMAVAMTPSATPLVTSAALKRLKHAGLHRLAISLDGATAATHDAFRRVPGSFQRTLDIIADSRAIGLPVQINTTIGRHNLHELPDFHRLVAQMDAVLWSVFFIVPTGRATAELRLGAEQCERVFQQLWQFSRESGLAIKTTEAPHYRRYILQQQKRARADGTNDNSADGVTLAAAGPVRQIGTNDGKGVMFISHTGEIYPSGFLPIRCGSVPQDSAVEVYQSSELFRALRDADRLEGKCGRCEYRTICGGSRSRAYAMSGNPLAEEPDCLYVPPLRGTVDRPHDDLESEQLLTGSS
jgi:AdoMet-dependent heme synthase